MALVCKYDKEIERTAVNGKITRDFCEQINFDAEMTMDDCSYQLFLGYRSPG